MRHVVEKHRAGAALGTVAAQLGAGKSEFVTQRPSQRFLLHDVDATLLAVDVKSDQAIAQARGVDPKATKPERDRLLTKLRCRRR